VFTGIIEAKGEISSLEQAGGDLRAVISSGTLDFSDIKPGDSICVSGVCLTAIEIYDNSFTVDISNETIALTSFTRLQAGDMVNLEKAMQPASRFGGHIVSGHVDGLVELLSREDDGRSERLVFLAPETLRKYIAAKGSVCLEGISLTVNEVNGAEFGVNIIPHTAQVTTLSTLEPGSKVNLEVDIISRYLESLILGREVKGDSAAITFEKLVQFGFAEETEYSKQGRDKS
jgi:riboflavin synthase